jgi:hypothetical protein
MMLVDFTTYMADDVLTKVTAPAWASASRCAARCSTRA